MIQQNIIQTKTSNGIEGYICSESGLDTEAWNNGDVLVKTEGCNVDSSGKSKYAPINMK